MKSPWLMQGDCLERMNEIPDGSVDMVLCDLPFAVTRNKWDVAIPFEPLWEQYHRVCKPNAAIVLHCQQPFTTDLICSNRKEFKYLWYWHKKQVSGFLNAKKQPLRSCEEIAVFYGKQPTYNPKMRKGKTQVKATGRGSNCYGKFTFRPNVCSEYYPTTLLEVPLPRYKGGHPTQKPVALLEYLIRTYTNEGETVLDNCMGSGSTGVACMNTGRRFIGIELDEGYFNVAQERIEKAKPSHKMEV
jgi:site-specific DNA-methyltransferase (adenine-specific)